MPKFTSVDVLFAHTPEGWTFNSSYPRFFGRPWTYLLTEAQKEALEERLNHVALMIPVLVFMFVALSAVLGAFGLFHDFVHRLEAGSPGSWLLACVVYVVLTSALISALFFVRHRVIESVLRTARRIGPAQPDWLGFIILKKMIRRYMERKSAKILIIWFVFLLLFSAYGTILDALVIPAPSVLTLFATVGSLLWICDGLVRGMDGEAKANTAVMMRNRRRPETVPIKFLPTCGSCPCAIPSRPL